MLDLVAFGEVYGAGNQRYSAGRNTKRTKLKNGIIKMNKRIWFGFFILLAGMSCAEVRFAPIFNDGAVLQCEMKVNVWGSADPGETVTVSFAGQSKKTVADPSGKWMLQLDPMPPSMEPRTLSVVSAIGNQQSAISNVTVGEVWLATGQSNMVFPLRPTEGGEERLAKTIPEIRFAVVPQKTGLPVEERFTPQQLAWKEFKPSVNAEIAAVAFYFAEKLQVATGHKVGIIQSSYGGTPCEAWTPDWALAAKPELKYFADAIRGGLSSGKNKDQWVAEEAALKNARQLLDQWNKTKTGARPKDPGASDPGNPWSSKSPTVLYENMITPLVPYTVRGIIWYQGEANAGKPDQYRVLFPAMIEAWRKVWERPDMPFLFVQLAAYNQTTQDWPELRAAQAFTRDTVKNTGMALAIDCGEKQQIHPRFKQPVGERLARLALNQAYGKKIVSRGPAFKQMKIKDRRVLVEFSCAEDGLRTSDGKAEVPAFEVAGSDDKFQPVYARIVAKDAVELTCESIIAPVSVRYAWANWVEPSVTLQNSAGLPAEPFCQKSVQEK